MFKMKIILGLFVALQVLISFTSAQDTSTVQPQCVPVVDICPPCAGGKLPKVKIEASGTCVQCRCPLGLTVCTKKKADITFVLDSSGSIRLANQAGSPDNWRLILEFVVEVVEQLEIGLDDVRVAVVSYSNSTTINFDLDDYSDKDDLINAIRSVPYIPERLGLTDLLDAWTNTAGAINAMRSQIFVPANRRGDRSNVQNIAITVTDGVSNINHQLTVPYADQAHDDGITMYAVGITDQVKELEIAGISSTGVRGDTYWLSPSFSAVKDIVDTIVEKTCKNISTEWGPWQPWGRCSRTCGGGVQRRTRDCISDLADTCEGPTYMTRTCNTQPCCGTVCRDRPVDLTFVLDSSGSIRQNNPPDADNWALMLDFMAQIVSRLDIGPNQIRVGAVSFSDRANVDFKLDTYYDKNQLLEAIRKIGYMDSVTNTQEGLETMRTRVFDPLKLNNNGDRSNVDNVAIVITDGESNVNEHNTIPIADLCDSEGIYMLVVGISDKIKEAELAGISSTGKEFETYWKSTSYSVSDDIINQIVTRTCNSSKDWTPWSSWSECTKTCEGGTQFRTRVCKDPQERNCVGDRFQRRTCNTQSCTGIVCTGEKADIVFVLDSSNSITEDNWDVMLQFVLNLVDKLNVGEDDIRVGMVTYSNETNVDFELDTYFDKTAMENAIRDIPYMNAWTNTAAGIRAMHKDVFDTSGFNRRGDRSNVKNIAITITDGASNINRFMTIPYADQAYNDGIEMLAVGITPDVQEDELSGISGTGVRDESYWMAPSYEVSETIIESIIKKTCEKISGWSQWSPWSPCTASCGGGEQRRTRICGGGSCPGKREDTRFCNFQSCENEILQAGRGPVFPGQPITPAVPMCENKYRNGQKWTKKVNGLPYECTCSITGTKWSSNCIPKGCRYEGLVYNVGESWVAPSGNSILQCRCEQDGQRTRTICDPGKSLPAPTGRTRGGPILCEGRYRDNEVWEKTDQGMLYDCTCTTYTNSWSSKCRPKSCRYEGRVYKIGDKWQSTQGGNRLNCRCEARRKGAIWICDPVLLCDGRYKDGDKWTKDMSGVPHECTCSIRGNRISSNCVSTGCRYDGRVYRVGQTWRSGSGATAMQCRCERSGRGTRYQCDPVFSTPLCDNRYRHNETWTRTVRGMPYECRCTIRGNRTNTRCNPTGCRHSGKIYRAGEKWQSGSLTCNCYKTGSSTRWSCQ